MNRRERDVFLQVDRSLDIDQSQYVYSVFRTGSQFIEVTESLGDPHYWKHLENRICRENEGIMSRYFCLETRVCAALHRPSINPGSCASGGGED